jgi:hypothetical protein
MDTTSTAVPPTQGSSAQDSGTPVEQVKEVAGQAQDSAKQAAGQAREQARTQIDQRTTQAGEQIATQASDVRTVAEELRKQGKDKPAQIADQFADRTEKLGSYLKDADADKLLKDVEDFGRRQPLALALGGLAAGLFASRFLKASSQQRFESNPTYTSRPTGALPQQRNGLAPPAQSPPPAPTTPYNPAGLSRN